jgi:hypothetical protein
MLKQLESEQPPLLYQEVIVYDIAQNFGDEFVYTNQNGNLAISRRVLEEFRKLTEATVVWERGERMWRKREPYDPPNKRQVD